MGLHFFNPPPLMALVEVIQGDRTSAAVIDRAPFFIGFERETPVWPDGGTCEPATCPQIAMLAAGPAYFLPNMASSCARARSAADVSSGR